MLRFISSVLRHVSAGSPAKLRKGEVIWRRQSNGFIEETDVMRKENGKE